jgi:hypothetical protein
VFAPDWLILLGKIFWQRVPILSSTKLTPVFVLQEVEVNLDNYQIVHLRPGLSASVNGKSMQLAGNAPTEIADEAGTVLLQLQAAETPERLISVNMPANGFHIIYTGSSTLIMVSLN